jgi:outer membrane protein assembly factor BamB
VSPVSPPSKSKPSSLSKPLASLSEIRRAPELAAFSSSLALVLAALAPVPAEAEDWGQWRGPERTARSSETGILKSWPETGLALSWKTSGLGAGYATVAVADGRLYTLGDVGEKQFVVALSTDGGKELWRTQIGNQWECQYGFSGARSTPTVDGDRLYALSTDGGLFALSTKDGKVIWQRDLPKDFGGQLMNDLWAWSESPLVDGDRLIVTPGGDDAALVALDKNTGKEIWRSKVPSLGEQGADGAAFSSIVISNADGVKQYVQLLGRGVVGVAAEDGQYLWGYNKVANKVANIPTPVVSGDYVFASTSYDTGSALLKIAKKGDAWSAEEVYFLEPGEMQNHHGGFVLHEGHLYSGNGHNKGFPLCIELETGEVKWGPVRNEGKGSAAVAFVDGHLVYRYQSGHVVLIEATPEKYVQKGVFELPELKKESWPHPVIAGGKLYLRENDNLFVYDLKKGA